MMKLGDLLLVIMADKFAQESLMFTSFILILIMVLFHKSLKRTIFFLIFSIILIFFAFRFAFFKNKSYFCPRRRNSALAITSYKYYGEIHQPIYRLGL